jgi:hypothetical protein
MSFKLIVRNKLRVQVKGTINDENGKPVPFSFALLCDRLPQSQIDAALKNKDESVVDFLKPITQGWEDMLDATGQPLPFSAEKFDEVMEEAGVPAVCFQAYLKAVGATAKN